MSKIVNNIVKTVNIPKSCHERYLNLKNRPSGLLSSKGIHFSGISELKKGYLIGRSKGISSHMIIFTESGEGFLKTADSDYSLTADTVICVPPGIPCMYGVKRKSWNICWFYIKALTRWKSLIERGVHISHTGMISKIKTAMEGFISESGTGGLKESTGYSSEKAGALYAEIILIQLDKALSLVPSPETDLFREELEKLWQEVMHNPAGEWNVENLASKMNVSASTLQRKVKSYYMKTPWQMVIKIKMDNAANILLSTDYPLKIVAEKFGYSDEFVFSNAFKNYHGVSPMAFRKQTIRFRIQKASNTEGKKENF